MQTEGTEVPSILNQQPYAQPARAPLIDQIQEPTAEVPEDEAPEAQSYDVNDVPTDEWNKMAYIDPQLENTPRPRLMDLLQESVRQAQAAKAGKVQ